MEQLIQRLQIIFQADHIPISEEGVVSMTVNDRYQVNFEHHLRCENIVMYHVFTPQVISLHACRALLMANSMGSHTGGAHFAMDPMDGELILQQHLLLPLPETEQLSDVMALFLNNITKWDEELPAFLQEDEKKQLPSGHRFV